MHLRPALPCLWLAAAAATASLVPASATADDGPGAARPGIERFIRIKWPVSGRLAPDGRFYYAYNPEGVHQLYRAGPGSSTAGAKQLTHFKDGTGGEAMSRDGRYFAITAAVGGSEQSNLYLLDTSTDKLTELFVDPEVVYGGVTWRRDSRAFAYRANDESPADFHVYLYDLATGSHRKVYAGKGHHYAADFNSDGTRLVVGKYHSASYSQLFEVDLASGESREITPAGEQWSFFPVGYTADDRAFVVNTDYQGDLRTLHTIDLADGSIRPTLPGPVEYNVDFATFNEDRSILAVAFNREGYRTLHLYRAGDLAPLDGPDIPEGLVDNVDFTGPYMLYSVNNANTPGVIYRWNANEPGRPAVPLTQPDAQGIDVSGSRLPELARYTSFDGASIPAFLYLPDNYTAGVPIAFIISYHGGPEGQYRPSFDASFQYFLSRGFGIMAPNVRGSSGYGKAYLEADNYKNRFKSVKDGVWAARYLVESGYANEGMIGAIGGSYGGFMVMAVITEAPELFGAACSLVGICNFETFLEQTKSYRRHLREAEYGPLSDSEFLRSISPIYNVDRIQTPLMLAHGLNDPRVPIGEALQVAVALLKRGQTVEQLYFPDEGHGFRKEENRILYYTRLADFFARHLVKGGTRQVARGNEATRETRPALGDGA